MITNIDSTSNPRLKKLWSQKDEWLFLEGEKLLKDVLRRQINIEILVVNKNLEKNELKDLAGNPKIHQIWLASEKILKKISELKSPPDYIGVTRPPLPVQSLTGRLILAFCDLQDPGNAGSIFRCAAAFGVNEIAFIGDSVKITNRKFIRSAQNSIFEVHSARFPTLESFLDILPGHRFNIYLTSSRSRSDVYSPEQIKPPAVVIFGNEGRGIDEYLLGRYPVVKIPQARQVESLNLGISACIIMHELSKTFSLL